MRAFSLAKSTAAIFREIRNPTIGPYISIVRIIIIHNFLVTVQPLSYQDAKK